MSSMFIITLVVPLAVALFVTEWVLTSRPQRLTGDGRRADR
ncbi:hypothetical protein [Halalkalicoccus jeotgali]|uniref:Uncharacterized protein n=1 Tax=Halalkalicoccus jeotgali (strain DSM 18796 / CECT 7217 / JCM 14584 / KCTC 4019 / B3) TaxID=795797 RepID=D8J347_HALJB|nr:hypothetical protein [Halalkalicoccus jeotgali]ADJ15154.1 hypothetical protein HacjB3_08855 [Halalkalicoccus jeotgali B3]ELY35126.1 hypothetical protein C497_13825 [Halalkalicoccus jeotgali B3]